MKWLTLDQIKAQLRIEPRFTDEDTLLNGYGTSAESTVLNHLNRTYYDLVEQYGEVPQPIIDASKMLVDVWYKHRSPEESLNMSIVPYTFDLLIKPYMKLAGSIGGEDYQYVPEGSGVKIEFTTDLPDDLTLADVDFTGKVINADKSDVEVTFTKADCFMVDNGKSYVLPLDTTNTGIGMLLMRVVVQIPDSDFRSGYRRGIVKINPKIIVTG